MIGIFIPHLSSLDHTISLFHVSPWGYDRPVYFAPGGKLTWGKDKLGHRFCCGLSHIYVYISLLLISCLIKVKEHVKRYSDKDYEHSYLNLCWSIDNYNVILKKLEHKPALSVRLFFSLFIRLYHTF